VSEFSWNRVKAVLWKDLLELRKNKGMIYSMLALPTVIVLVPLGIVRTYVRNPDDPNFRAIALYYDFTVDTANAARFLVDAGSGVGGQLVQAGVRPYDWPPIFITHHHSDHTIDIGHLLITRWIVGRNAPLEIYGPAGTRRQMDKLLDWLRLDIDIRREHMQERQPPEVRVTEVDEGTVLERDGLRVSAFLVEHDPVKPAFGFAQCRVRYDWRGFEACLISPLSWYVLHLRGCLRYLGRRLTYPPGILSHAFVHLT
jgi:hypothetical protein